MAGTYLSDVYRRVMHFLGEEQLKRLRHHHGDDKVLYRDFLSLAVLGGYKAGERRVGEGLRMVLQDFDLDTAPTGQDLYLLLADKMRAENTSVLARYGTHSRAYVSRVFAQTAMLTYPD